jgi:hypothetical protein
MQKYPAGAGPRAGRRRQGRRRRNNGLRAQQENLDGVDEPEVRRWDAIIRLGQDDDRGVCVIVPWRCQNLSGYNYHWNKYPSGTPEMENSRKIADKRGRRQPISAALG